MTTAKTKHTTITPLSCTWRSIEGCLFIYGQVAKLVDAPSALGIITGSSPVLTTKLNTMNEQQIQTKIKRKLIERGWYVTKLIKTSTNGIPDLLAIKYGKAMFIEVKREGGKLSPIQELRIEELKAAGAIVKIWTDFDTDFN